MNISDINAAAASPAVRCVVAKHHNITFAYGLVTCLEVELYTVLYSNMAAGIEDIGHICVFRRRCYVCIEKHRYTTITNYATEFKNTSIGMLNDTKY